MRPRLATRAAGCTLLAFSLAGAPALAYAQEAPVNTSDALEVVGNAMGLRRGAFEDTLPYDACSIHEQTGRPENFPAGLSPGLIPLLDRTGPDPCAQTPVRRTRFPHIVRVDSVRFRDSTAVVSLSIQRNEWSYKEHFRFARLRDGRGWGFRESRMTNPFRITRSPTSARDAPPW